LKLAVAPVGKPLAENTMVLPKLPLGSRANLNSVLWPGKTVADCAGPEVVKVKSRTSCESAAAVLAKKLPLPL